MKSHCFFALLLIGLTSHIALAADPESEPTTAAEQVKRQLRDVAGWKLHIHPELLEKQPEKTARAIELLDIQLREVQRVLPPAVVAELQQVPLYFSPEYPNRQPLAEFHPDAGWLRANKRDPAMAKAVEFTNIRIFEREVNRMPNFALHELAHAYHFRVVEKGFQNAQIKSAYEQAKSKGLYEKVERHHGNGKPNTFERAYAMTTPQEYFAETSEALLTRNDFFPFTREELQRHDPEMFALLKELWRLP